jgi:hypothetical protein
MPWEVLLTSNMQPRPICHVIITCVDTLNKALKGYTFKLGNVVQKVIVQWFGEWPEELLEIRIC